MKTKVNVLFTVVITALLATILAGSVRAQWTLVSSDNDNDGKEIKRVERHTNGSVRTMTRRYFPGTRIRASEEVITTFLDGSRTRVEEQRDKLDRVSFIYNGVKNRAGATTRGVQQYFSYKDAQDRSGSQRSYRYDPASKKWKRM